MKLKIVFSFLLMFLSIASSNDEIFIYSIDQQTTYADICIEYERMTLEKGNDSCLLLKTTKHPLFAIHSNIFSNWRHRYMLYLRKDNSVLCWYDNDAATPLIYDGLYYPEKVADKLKESVIKKNIDASEIIEFVIHPECFETPIIRHIELLHLISATFDERPTYIHIKSYPEKL